VLFLFRDLGAQQRGAGKRRCLRLGIAQPVLRAFKVASLDGDAGKLAQIVRRDATRRCRLDACQLPISTEGLLPIMLTLVDQAQGVERARAQARYLAHLLKQAFRAVQQPGPQIILRQRQQGLFAMLGRQCVPRQ
jgi:hypothetical protein